jgi:mRNA interferase RelE/StbE
LKNPYEIRYTPRFSKGIRTLDRETKIQVLEKVLTLKTDPYAGKPLRGEWKGVYSLKSGSYRVLYQVEGNVIFLLVASHRKHAYK